LNVYTVIRFTTSSEAVPALLAIGPEMNAIRADVFDGPRRRGDGFVCSVCSASAWTEHERAILAFLGDFATAIRGALDMDALVVVDVAVEPDAQRLWLSLPFGAHFLRTIADSGVRFEVSVYPVAAESGNDSR
jgi:hypothetical protein